MRFACTMERADICSLRGVALVGVGGWMVGLKKMRGCQGDKTCVPNTVFAVPRRLVPFPPTRPAVRAARALLRGAFGAGEEFGQDVAAGEGRQLGGGGHPAGQVCFERRLVVVARDDGFAGDFDHDVAAAVLRGKEDVGAVEDAADARAPGRGAVGVVVHVGGAHEEGAGVVGPLDLGRVRAVNVRVGAVVDGPCRRDELGGCPPVPRFLGPVGVGLVAGVASQSCCQLEEATVGDAVLVIVSSVEGENLPPQSSVAGRCVPPTDLQVEDGLSEGKPLW